MSLDDDMVCDGGAWPGLAYPDADADADADFDFDADSWLDLPISLLQALSGSASFRT